MPALECGEIDKGLDERSHGAFGIQGPVEAVVADVAPANDRNHVPALRRRDDDRALEAPVRLLVHAVEPLELAFEGALRLFLHARLETGVDA